MQRHSIPTFGGTTTMGAAGHNKRRLKITTGLCDDSSNIASMISDSATADTLPTTAITLDTLPVELIFLVMDSLPPSDILSVSHVSTRLRILSSSQLAHSYDIFLDQPLCSHQPWDASLSLEPKMSAALDPGVKSTKAHFRAMSTFEAYLRTVLSDFYFEEMRATDPKNITVQALYSCRRILRRLYILDHEGTSRATARCKVRADDRVDTTEAEPSSTFIALPSPFITTTENIHVIARVIADQVCRGICLPETAVLILQTFSSLRDQSLLRYMMTNPPQDRTLQFSMQNRVSIGALCYQYLIPGVLSLLRPVSGSPQLSQTQQQQQEHTGVHIFQPISKASSGPSVSIRILTNDTLSTQQALLRPISIRSVIHLTRVLCFLPLVGRHFNSLPTSTFIETFLDRSRGDLPIDRATVMVYGFMCVLDLETGKANLCSDSFKIFERSMPTRGVVQAKEIVRVMDRHSAFMRQLLHTAPACPSVHFSKDTSSVTFT